MQHKYELILQRAQGVSERFPLEEAALTIGRGPENTVVLQDQLVSRHHARIVLCQGVVTLEDLESRNGVELNGQRVLSAVLKDGDIFRIGETAFRLATVHESGLGHTIIGRDRAEELYQRIVSGDEVSRLPVLYQAAQLLGTVFDTDELLDKILALIFTALPARRGYVITLEQGVPEPVVHATRSLEDNESGPPLSHTLIQHVLERNEAMLTLNAQEDSRFDMSASIVSHEIRAAMCAPLCGRQQVVGAIYVDSGASSRAYTREDLELLTAISHVVGVAVENARLYQENVAKERMAAVGLATAGLGHCVKNILTGIRGGAEFVNMALERDDIAYLRKGWPILSFSIDRIDMLVNNMLSYSRDRQPERTTTNLHEMLREIVASQEVRAQRHKVFIELRTAGDGRVDVDQREIFRVLLNLLVNAIEACIGDGGRVIVSCTTDNDGATIVMEDSGCGIPDEVLPRLSEAFVSTKGSGGTGLGLACSYKIIREHGGRIDVENLAGEGARFTIFIPHVPCEGVPTQRVELGSVSS